MRILALSILLGCGGAEPSDTEEADADTDADADADADSDADADTDAPDVAPTVLLGDAWCYLHDTGVENWRWNVAAAGEDPQGSSTLKPFGHEVAITKDGAGVATYLLSCQQDGDCTTSFLESEYGVLCAQAASYTFTIRLEDADGNWSEPFGVSGRQGTGPEG